VRKGEWSRALESRPPIYIGDELTGAGFRLAGPDIRSPTDAQLPEAFRRALKETDLLLLDVAYARRLPAGEVREAVRGLSPLVLIFPDIRNRTTMRDIEQRLSRELGVQL